MNAKNIRTPIPNIVCVKAAGSPQQCRQYFVDIDDQELMAFVVEDETLAIGDGLTLSTVGKGLRFVILAQQASIPTRHCLYVCLDEQTDIDAIEAACTHREAELAVDLHERVENETVVPAKAEIS